MTRRYLGIDVFEGAYTYRGMHIVPGWGGSMFEALMPNMFVPEERWAPRSWGVNHPLMVRAHREHGLQEAGYGFWGFSPASQPGGGYREYGVDALGLNPEGYFSDVERTNVDAGFGDCREGLNPNPDFGDGVVTPHALFLAMHHEPYEAYRNLVKLERELDVVRRRRVLRCGRGGFRPGRPALPVAGPGDGDGLDRQRVRQPDRSAGVRSWSGEQADQTADRDGAILGWTGRVNRDRPSLRVPRDSPRRHQGVSG